MNKSAPQDALKLKIARTIVATDGDEADLEAGYLAEEAREAGLDRLNRFLSAKGSQRDFVAAVLQLSDFMRDTARRSPEIVDRLLETSPDKRLGKILRDIGALASSDETTEASLMQDLRRLKAEAHFLIALADLAGSWETAETVRQMSKLADACVAAAIDFLLLDADRQGSSSCRTGRRRRTAPGGSCWAWASSAPMN